MVCGVESMVVVVVVVVFFFFFWGGGVGFVLKKRVPPYFPLDINQ